MSNCSQEQITQALTEWNAGNRSENVFQILDRIESEKTHSESHLHAHSDHTNSHAHAHATKLLESLKREIGHYFIGGQY